MHVLVRTYNRIDWAGLYAQGAANAMLCVDEGNGPRAFYAIGGIEFDDRLTD